MKTALQSMCEKLEKLGIYRTDPDTNIYKELLVYHTALQEMTEQADSLLEEMITHTAQDYGLTLWENLWGISREDIPLEQRRENIRQRCMLGANDFTCEGMNAFLSSLGVEADMEEVTEHYRIYLHITNGEDFSIPIRHYLTQQIEEYFPAHCMVFADYRLDGTWDDIDAKRILFGVADSYGYTWNDWENFE